VPDEVERIVAAWNRHDLEELLAVCDPAIEFVPLIAHADGGMPMHGRDGVRRWWAEVEEVFEDRRVEVHERRERDGWTVVTGVGHNTGRGSRAQVDWPFVQVLRLRDGRVTHWRFFASEDEALEFIG
jgi:ketosteroid isomerase-like protein